jgi:hypothetical protein
MGRFFKDEVHTIGSTGSCLIPSKASAIDVSVSAPLAREERGAILLYCNPKGCEEQVDSPYASRQGVAEVSDKFQVAFVMQYARYIEVVVDGYGLGGGRVGLYLTRPKSVGLLGFWAEFP